MLENSELGIFVGNVSASDDDAEVFGKIRYSLASVIFRIDELDGSIFLNSAVNREDRSAYAVPVTAVDGGGLSTTISVTINILDENDNDPVFVTQILTASTREWDIGLDIPIKIMVTDSDFGPNSEISLSINDGSNIFNIQQVSNSEWELDTISHFELLPWLACIGDVVVFNHYVIIATDNGVPQRTTGKGITISITDINNHAPTVSVISVNNLLERSPIGTVVADFQVTDDDPCSPNNLYTLSVIEYGNMFRISNNQLIVSSNEIDYETLGTNIEVKIKAVDGGTPSFGTEHIVPITILDVNDERPQIINCTISSIIEENVLVGFPLGFCNISDVDTNSVLVYDLSCECRKGFTRETCELFSITETSTSISTAIQFDVNQNIDFEEVSEISCELEISDSAADDKFPDQTVATLIFVTIDDLNDNLPIFPNSTYRYSVPENVLVGQLVGTIHATDSDEQDAILYSISENDHIEIDSHTGEIKIKQTFDYE
mgnify:CR=1 FL=1